MKKRFALLLMPIVCLLAASCTVDLKPTPEAEEKFKFSVAQEPKNENCIHDLYYDIVYLHDNFNVYSNVEYHYCVCMYTTGNYCDYETAEAHNFVFNTIGPSTAKKYNGSYYHTVRYKCSKCRDMYQKAEYILCSDNSADCKNTCKNVLSFLESVKSEQK